MIGDFIRKWCPRTDSNRGPIDYKSIALPAELQGLDPFCRLFSLIYQLIQYKLNLYLARCCCSSQLSVTESELLWQKNRYENRYENNPRWYGISNLFLTSLQTQNGVEKNEKNKSNKDQYRKISTSYR